MHDGYSTLPFTLLISTVIKLFTAWEKDTGFIDLYLYSDLIALMSGNVTAALQCQAKFSYM